MKNLSIVLSLALVAMLLIPSVHADDKTSGKKTATPKTDSGAYTGVFVRDGNNLTFRINKATVYIIKPGTTADDTLKKQLDIANVDELAKSKWTIKGKLDGADNGRSILMVDSLTNGGSATAKKKK